MPVRPEMTENCRFHYGWKTKRWLVKIWKYFSRLIKRGGFFNKDVVTSNPADGLLGEINQF